MSLLGRLWNMLRGRHTPNPREQRLRAHALQVVDRANRVAERIRSEPVRDDYRRADGRIRGR